MEGDALDRPGQDLPVRRSRLPAGSGLHGAGRVIRKLRRKIADARNPKYILSERGLGYRMPGPEDG